jgi:hypothetical protein
MPMSAGARPCRGGRRHSSCCLPWPCLPRRGSSCWSAGPRENRAPPALARARLFRARDRPPDHAVRGQPRVAAAGRGDYRGRRRARPAIPSRRSSYRGHAPPPNRAPRPVRLLKAWRLATPPLRRAGSPGRRSSRVTPRWSAASPPRIGARRRRRRAARPRHQSRDRPVGSADTLTVLFRRAGSSTEPMTSADSDAAAGMLASMRADLESSADWGAAPSPECRRRVLAWPPFGSSRGRVRSGG